MPEIEIQIDGFQVTAVQSASGMIYTPTNSSVEVGDTIYYAPWNDGVLGEVQVAGNVTGFTSSGYIKVNIGTGITIAGGSFILFSKPIQINESSMKGYYADVTLENYSNKKAELFSIGSEIVPSSK